MAEYNHGDTRLMGAVITLVLSSFILFGKSGRNKSGGSQEITNDTPTEVSGKVVGHPYYPPDDAEKQSAIQKADALLKSYTEEQWLNLVPKQSPRTSLNEPFDGSKEWVWSPTSPDRIATDKGVVFPNTQYPYKFKSVKVMSGKIIQVPYVDYKGKMVLVQARIDYEKTSFMSKNLPVLATAYLVTKNEKYARRAALALDAWATTVPDFYMTGKNKAELIGADAIANYYNSDIQRVSDHNGIAHEMHSGEILAFDRIYESDALKQLSLEKGYDVKAHIEKDFFLNVTDWLINCQSMRVHTSTNLSGAAEAIVRVATVTETPALIEWMDRYLEITVGNNFKRDGMFPESFSYHEGYSRANYGIVKLIAYYFEVHGAGSNIMKQMEKKIGIQYAFLEKTRESHKSVAFPDGDLAPFHDTIKGVASPRTSTRSTLLPAYGHLMLGDGENLRQIQFNVNFNDFANHVHPNVLSTALYAFGKEQLGGIRYSRIPTRNFSQSTLSTNTVVVDKKNQYRGEKQGRGNSGHLFTEGNLSLYEPGINGIQASEVYSKWAYPDQAQRYQRLNILNTMDPEHPYVIDLFRVEGGQTHDYFLHGSTQFDETGEASFGLVPLNKDYPLLEDGETWTDPTKESDKPNWYGMFRDISTGRSPGNWCVTFKDSHDGLNGTRIFMVDDGSSDIYLGKSPHSYREKVYEDIYKFWRPSLMVRREAALDQPLDSFFIGVMEPLLGESAIDRVEKLELADGSSEHLALSVQFKDGRRDVILVNLNNPDISGSTAADQKFVTADGKYALNGRIGIASSRNGLITPYLISGSKFRYEQKELTLEQPILTGTITKAVRREDGSDVDALLTETELPLGEALHGKWISLHFGAYSVVPDAKGQYPNGIKEQKGISEMFLIDRVERRGGITYIIVAEDHALSLKNGKTTELLRPQRTFNGLPVFRLSFSKTDPKP